MSQDLVIRKNATSALALPNIITREGERTTKRFLEFFTANIRNKNTRMAYARSVSQFLIGASIAKSHWRKLSR